MASGQLLFCGDINSTANPWLFTFDLSVASISICSPSGQAIVGGLVVNFDLLSGGLWAPAIGLGIGLSAINSGTIVATSLLGTGSVDGLRPRLTGNWTGLLKLYAFIP